MSSSACRATRRSSTRATSRNGRRVFSASSGVWRRAWPAFTASPPTGRSSRWRSESTTERRYSVLSRRSSARRGSSWYRTRARPTPTSPWPTRPPGTTAWPNSSTRPPSPSVSRLGTDHIAGAHPPIVLLGAHVPGGERRIPQGEPARVRLLGDLGRAVVADMGRERRHEHERPVDELRDPGSVRLDPLHAELAEVRAGVGQQIHRVQEVEDDDRLEDVQLE